MKSNISYECTVCGKTEFDFSTNCRKSHSFSPAVGDWICQFTNANILPKNNDFILLPFKDFMEFKK